MPVYHYRGTECDHEFEVRQSFSDDPIATCEVCGNPVRRVIHASPVVFKGSGWYVTDSRPTTDPVGGVQETTKVTNDSDTKKDSSDAKPAEKKKEPVTATTSKAE